MPPAFNLSQDQTLHFDLCYFWSYSLTRRNDSMSILWLCEYFRFFLSLLRLQSSVPTLIGSSVRIFKERVAFSATRIEILQKSIAFCKSISKYFSLTGNTQKSSASINRQNPRDQMISGVLKGLARQCPTFTGNTTNYHRPKSVSLSCSEWEGVVPLRYGRRAKGFDSKLALLVEFFAKRSKALRAAFAVFMSFILIKPSR